MKILLIAAALFSCTVPRQQVNNPTGNEELLQKIEEQDRKIEQLLAQDAAKQQMINELTTKINDPNLSEEEREGARQERRSWLVEAYQKAEDMGLVERGIGWLTSQA